MRGARVLELLRSPWALERRSFDLMVGIVDRWARGEAAPVGVLEQVRADVEDRQRRRGSRSPSSGGVAVMGIYGVLSQRGNLLDDLSGGGSVSTQMLSQTLREAIADDSVDSILLDIDSPGGSVYGVAELANEICEASKAKPIVAVANSLAASAAYWLGSQASELYVTPGGEVGSIGVVAAHTDFSAANVKAGIKVTYITAGRYKAESNSDTPLTAEARDYEQTRVDDYYSAFTRGVARGRGTTVATVRGDTYGEGRVLGARDAMTANMVDGVKTFDEAVARARQLAKQPLSAKPVRSSLAAIEAAHRAARLRIAALD